MKGRCYTPTDHAYAEYGGRGIAMSPEWEESFANFRADMGQSPPGMTIERKDNNGNYCKENCIWATRKAQANNRRSNRLIEYNGVTKTMTQWAESCGITSAVLWARLNRGWPVERAVQKAC